MGLQAALDIGAKRIHIESDSELMVKQLNGLYRVRDEKLKALHRRALGLLQRFDRYRITHVRREHNRIADKLANQGVERGLEREYRGSETNGSKLDALS